MKRFFKLSLLAIVLAISLVVGSISPIPAKAAEKAKTKRAIAIVFDNSGSMYDGQNAWCRAIYAMEVFAAMMNEGDTLQIYPMWPVTAGGVEYSKDKNPLTISSKADVEKIRDIYTVKFDSTGAEQGTGTPIDTIQYAGEGIAKVSADERWLVVLTDGTYFHGTEAEDFKNLGADSKRRLEEELSVFIPSMNVLFLGIATTGAPQVPTEISDPNHIYSSDVAQQSAEVLQKLTGMCNTIFGRDTLRVNGSNVSFDVSMSKLIVFVQGQNISNVELKDASGNTIKMDGSAYSPRYSERGREKGGFKIDTELSGTIATYGAMDAGSYSISYSGNASSVEVYYEPDVDLAARVVDANGDVVDPDNMTPGEYYIEYGMVDRNGNWTNSSLLGKTDYSIKYAKNGQVIEEKANSAGKIPVQVETGDKLEASNMKVVYLSGYTILKSGAELGWPAGGYIVNAEPMGELSFSGLYESQVKLSELDGMNFGSMDLFYEGEPLLGSELDKTTFEASVENGNVVIQTMKTDKGYDMSLFYPGSMEETKTGKMQFTMKATYLLEDGRTAKASQTEEFEIVDDRYKFDVALKSENSSYLTKSKYKKDGKSIILNVAKDGKPLTAEEMELVDATIELEGIKYDVIKHSDKSAFEIKITDPDPALGTYKIKATATTRDAFHMEASDTYKFKIALYPAWLPWLIGALVILLILLLIWAFMNMKVLPKQIAVNEDTVRYLVGMDKGSKQMDIRYNGGGKKTGSLSIDTTDAPAGTTGPLGVTLKLQAVSPRRVRSADRSADVMAISPNGNSLTIRIAGTTFGYNPKVNDSFCDMRARSMPEEGEVLFTLSDGERLSSEGTGTNAYGRETKASLNCNIQFF